MELDFQRSAKFSYLNMMQAAKVDHLAVLFHSYQHSSSLCIACLILPLTESGAKLVSSLQRYWAGRLHGVSRHGKERSSSLQMGCFKRL